MRRILKSKSRNPELKRQFFDFLTLDSAFQNSAFSNRNKKTRKGELKKEKPKTKGILGTNRIQNLQIEKKNPQPKREKLKTKRKEKSLR